MNCCKEITFLKWSNNCWYVRGGKAKFVSGLVLVIVIINIQQVPHWSCTRSISAYRELPLSPNFEVTPVYLKKNILQGVRQLFGEEGTKSQIDILKFNRANHRFVLRCPSDSYTRLRAVLTLATTYEGKTCVYTVHQASPNLLSLTANSRTYVHIFE